MALEEFGAIVSKGLQVASPDLLFVFVLLVFAIIGVKIIEHVTKSLRRKTSNPLKIKLISGTIQVVFVTVILVMMLSRIGVTEDVLKLIGLIVGGIVAFSSTSLIINLVSGVILHITKPFSLGDIIEVNGIIGRVEDVKPVHTELYTFKKTTVHIPNSVFIKESIINYSKTGFRISIKVSLSYNVNRVQAEDTLIKAAKFVHLEDVFVTVTSLENHMVEYELNGTSHEPNAMPFVESQLRKMILDEFAIAKLEIMSPTVIAHRSTNKVMPQAGLKEKIWFRRREKEDAIAIHKLVRDTFKEEKKSKKGLRIISRSSPHG